MESLEGKKLLILGGSAYMVDPVLTAKRMGVYTIVTDLHGYEKSPAKHVADEYWDISLMDYEQLVPKIKEREVDGILTGFTDAFLMAYQHLCELTGLPCYATKEVFETTKDKARFKQLCRENGVPVIPEYDIDTFDPNWITDNNKVIIKPVDNSGSQGVILCERPEDYPHCLDFALSFSEQKKVIIEKYMELDSISASYTFQNGTASLSTLNDRYVHKAKGAAAVTCAGIYPSKYYNSYIEKMDGKMKAMFQNAGLKNGVVAVQFFTNGDDYYVMEMGHRLSGGQHYTYSKQENDVSALECMIHFAVTGKMADFSIAQKDHALFKHVYCHLFILGKQEKIARIEGLDYLHNMPETISLSLMKSEGEMIGQDGTSNQKIVGLHLKLKSREELPRILNDIQEHFHVYDEQGNDLVIDLMK